MISSIELSNWKTHRETVMDFRSGVNVLIGVMGSGKSSVMDAVSFGLFGTFPALAHKRVSTKDLISKNSADHAEVRLHFSVGSDRYTVTRRISRKESTTSRLEKNGAYLQTQTERVNEEIEAVLKTDYDTFSRAIYAEQNRLDYFLELAKGDRKRQIDEMLGLDSFARAEENATSLVNNLRNMIKGEEQAIAQMDAGQRKGELERLVKERAGLEKEEEEAETLNRARREALKGLEERLESAKRQRDERDRLAGEIRAMKSRVETLKAELAKIMERGSAEEAARRRDLAIKEREKLSKEAKRLGEESSTMLRRLAQMEAELGHGRKSMAEMEKGRAELEKQPVSVAESELRHIQERIDRARAESSAALGSRQEAERALKELERHISKCPVCGTELDEATKARLIGEKRARMEEAGARMTVLKKDMESMESDLKRLGTECDRLRAMAERVKEYDVLKERVARLDLEAEQVRASHKETAARMEMTSAALEAAADGIRRVETELDAIKRRERYLGEIGAAGGDIAERERKLEGMRVSEPEIERLSGEFVRGREELKGAEERLRAGKAYLKRLADDIDSKTRELAHIAEMEEKVGKRRAQVASLNKFKSALMDAEAALRGRLVHSINALMQDIWRQIYPYGDYLGIRLNASKDDYALEASTALDADGAMVWHDVNGIASGGERSIACLALRISLSMVIVPNLKWLILDEPTHNIDENGIGKLVGVLGETLPGIVEQVFIITHDSAMKNIAGARIYQLERDKTTGGPTSYTEI